MSDGSQALRSLEEEIEQLPDATDSLMDEIDQMETDNTKSSAEPLTGSAAKYSVPGADGSNGTTAEAALAPGEAGVQVKDEAAAAGEEDKELVADEKPEKIYAERSFFCISRDNAVRKFCKPILDHPRFDQLSLTVIGLNCCTLALFDPLDPNCERTKCKVVSIFDWTWTIFFIVEFVFKWFVMGFTGKGGYWEDPWNRLDFTIVMFSLFDFMPAGVEIPGTSALRTLRAIRPLRALNKFPSLRILVNLLCETLPQMASVAILCFFIFFVMGIFAVQLWQGLFRQRCYSPADNFTVLFGDPNEDAYICGFVEGADQQSGMNKCAPDDCENAAFSSCLMQGPNPYWGSIHFDHIFGAWVSIFQCITLEAWVDIMYMTQDGYGFWAWLYFVALIIIGSWFAVNLCLVVISASFGATKSDQLAQMAAEVAKERALREQQERQDLRRKKLTWIEKLMIRIGRPPVKTEDDLAREVRVAKIEELEAEIQACKSEEEKEKMNQKLDNLDQELKALDEFHGDNDEEAATGVFLLCDVDGNGVLNLEEFKMHFKAKFGVGPEKCEQIFAEMDANSDGVLTAEEFRVGYVAFKDNQRNVCIRYRVKLRRVVMGDDFANLIMGAIGVNVVFMAIEFHGQPDALTAVVDIANFFFCMLFAAEMVLKLIAIGVLDYVSDGFNLFDGTIVIISIVELIGGGGGLSVLRTFRLVRVFRLISFLPTLQKQISVMIQTLGEVGSFLLILGLFIFIIAIVGMFIFGGQFTWDENGNKCDVETDYANNGFVWREGCVTDRKNFDSFNWAMITVFQVLTQEDWNAVMYNGVRSMGFATCIYPIFLIVFGNYILFNLFVAILIDGFAAPPEDEEEEEGGAEIEAAPAVAPIAGAESPAAKAGTGSGTGLSPVEGSGVGCGTGMELTVTANPVRTPRGTPRRRRVIDELIPGVPSNRRLLDRWGKLQAKRGPLTAWTGPVSRVGSSSSSSLPGSGTGSGFGDDAAAKDMIQSEDAVTTVTPMEVEAGKDSAVADVKPEDAAPAPAIVDPATSCRHRDTALFCFGPGSKFRENCQYLVDDTTKHGIWLDRFIMGTIICNSITLAMERPSIKSGSAERLFLDIAGNTFSFIFSVEFIIKIIAWNFVFGPNETPAYRKYKGPGTYWSEGWNQLDGTLVIISWIDLIMSQLPISGGPIMGLLKIFRILRALRPLRAVNKLPGLKLVVNCLLASLAPIGTTLIIVFTIFFIFGILGTQLFKGKMSYCAGASWVDDSSLPESAAAVRAIIAKEDCDYYNGFVNASLGVSEPLVTAWTRHYYNFDNLFQSLLTLFVLSSIDGWVDIMYQGTDAADDEYGEPIENNNWVMALYFVAFLLLGGFLILNMFVGVILENFNQAQEAEEERQRQAIARGEKTVEPEPEPVPDPLDGDFYVNYGPFRRRVYDMVRTDTFDSIIAAVIMSNVTIMATEHYDPADWFKVFLKVQNYTFSFIFLIEYIVKNIAYGLLYYGDNWCRFDFFLVLVSIFDLITEFVDAGLPINPTILRVARVMRIARILRLMKGQWAEDLRKLLVTVKNSLAQAGNLGLLLFLLYFICACLGIELFGRLACTETNPCEGMNNKANFEHFFIAILTLFRLSTGDNWNGILKDALREPPSVDADTCDYSVDCTPGCTGTNSTCCAGCNPADDCEENCCASSWMSPIYFCFFILAAQFVMLNLVVAVLMKELGDAEKADAEEQAALEKEGRRKSGVDESTSVEVLGEEGEKSRRKSFTDTMADGGRYWSRRFSQARSHKNVMYDFPDDSGKNVETIVAGTGQAVETSGGDLVPVQTGQSTMAPATPDRIAEAAALPERPPTRSAWGAEAQ